MVTPTMWVREHGNNLLINLDLTLKTMLLTMGSNRQLNPTRAWQDTRGDPIRGLCSHFGSSHELQAPDTLREPTDSHSTLLFSVREGFRRKSRSNLSVPQRFCPRQDCKTTCLHLQPSGREPLLGRSCTVSGAAQLAIGPVPASLYILLLQLRYAGRQRATPTRS